MAKILVFYLLPSKLLFISNYSFSKANFKLYREKELGNTDSHRLNIFQRYFCPLVIAMCAIGSRTVLAHLNYRGLPNAGQLIFQQNRDESCSLSRPIVNAHKQKKKTI